MGVVSGLLLIVLIGVVALVAVLVARRTRGETSGDSVTLGADVVTYLLMAVAVLVLGFSVASLARVAFPSELVFEPERQVASSLAAIAVSAPIAIVMWIRQRKRRLQGAGQGGWTVYLTVIEAAFTTAFVVALIRTLLGLVTGSRDLAVSDLVVYLAIIVFHEFALRDTPLGRNAHEIPRTVGAAIGFGPLVFGVGALVFEGLVALYDMVSDTASVGIGVPESLAWIAGGLAVWWYRWIYRWSDGHGPVRRSWAVFVAVASMNAMLGASIFIVGQVIVFLLTDTSPAASHFAFLPAAMTVGLVGLASWQHHRGVLGTERTDSVRFYEYLLAASGLIGMVGSITTLISVAFGQDVFVGSEAESAIMATTAALVSFGVWLTYWSRAQAQPRAAEAATTPRRLYFLVVGIIMAVVSAVSLISVLVMVFQAALGVDELSEVAVPIGALFLSSGLAAFHLLRTYARDRELIGEPEGSPFEVIVVCSHPGMLAKRLPAQARMRVVYRDDEFGVVDDGMADAIVEAVAGRKSMVWVDDTGFRIAPLR